MGRRSKPKVRGRARAHRAHVKAGIRMRKRRASRGLKTAAKRRKIRAAKRKKA